MKSFGMLSTATHAGSSCMLTRSLALIVLVSGCVAPIEESVSADAQVQWLADANLKEGGVVLHSAEGSLDARLEVQMRALQTLLLRTRVSA